MIQAKRITYAVSRICLQNGTTEIASIASKLDLTVLLGNSGEDIISDFCPDTLYLDIKDLDNLVENFSKYKLPV